MSYDCNDHLDFWEDALDEETHSILEQQIESSRPRHIRASDDLA